MATRSSTIATGTIASIIRWAVVFVVFWFLTPFIVGKLGKETYGLWSLLTSVLGMVGLTELGIGTTIAKYVAACRGRGDWERRNAIVSTVMVAYVLVVLITLIEVTLLSFCFVDLFAIPAAQSHLAVELLWIMAFTLVFVGIPLGAFSGILFAENRIPLMSICVILSTLLTALASWIVLEAGFGVVGLAWTNFVATVLGNGMLVVVAFASIPRFHISIRLVRPSLLWELGSFSIFAFPANIASLMLLRGGPVVGKFFLPLAEIAMYAIALRVFESLLAITKQFMNVCAVSAAESAGEGNKEAVRTLLIKGTRFSTATGCAGAVVVFVVAPDLIRIWLGAGFEDIVPVLRVLAVVLLVLQPSGMANNILGMTGRIRFIGGLALGSTASHLVLGLVLVRAFGLIGLAAGSLVTVVCLDLVFSVVQACRVYGVPLGLYFRRSVVPALLPGAVELAVGLGLSAVYQPSSFLGLAVYSSTLLSVYFVPAWFLTLEREERVALQLKAGRLLSIVLHPSPSHDGAA